MRKRSEEEKRAMGLISPILREMSIKEDSRGYMPLLDLLSYAYANPKTTFQEIMRSLVEQNDYVGVKQEIDPEAIENIEWLTLYENRKFSLYPSMRRCIVTCLERTNYKVLSQYGIEKLTFILKDDNIEEEERIKRELLSVIGEEYSKYETYEERVIVFFSRNILKHLGVSWE